MEVDVVDLNINPNFTDKALRDYRLVQLALEKGDRKAFAQLMDYYKDAIYFMLLKMTNNNDDADDLTIEAFGKAFRRLNQYTPNYAFSTWLFKIASNNCIDYIRKKKRNVNITDNIAFDDDYESDLTINVSSDEPNPEQELIRQQKVDAMRSIVEKLKPRYKTLVELRYFKEYSYEEISEELKLPIGTVKAQLFRAREFLYNFIKDTDYGIA